MPAEVQVVIGEMLRRGVRLHDLWNPEGPRRGADFHVPQLALAGRQGPVQDDGLHGKLPVFHPVARADNLDRLFGLDEFLRVFVHVTHRYHLPSAAGCRR